MVVHVFDNTYEDDRICSALKKTVHFGTDTFVNEIKNQGQCTKDIQLVNTKRKLILKILKCIKESIYF